MLHFFKTFFEVNDLLLLTVFFIQTNFDFLFNWHNFFARSVFLFRPTKFDFFIYAFLTERLPWIARIDCECGWCAKIVCDWLSISLKLFETTHIWGHRLYYQKFAGQKTSMKSLSYFDERIEIERNKRNIIERNWLCNSKHSPKSSWYLDCS